MGCNQVGQHKRKKFRLIVHPSDWNDLTWPVFDGARTACATLAALVTFALDLTGIPGAQTLGWVTPEVPPEWRGRWTLIGRGRAPGQDRPRACRARGAPGSSTVTVTRHKPANSRPGTTSEVAWATAPEAAAAANSPPDQAQFSSPKATP